MATHSSILAWKIPWTEEASRLQSMGSQRVGYDSATKKQQSLHLSPCKIDLLPKLSPTPRGIAHLPSVRGHTKQRQRGGVKPLSSAHVTFLILRKECPKATAAFCLCWGPGDSESASLQCCRKLSCLLIQQPSFRNDQAKWSISWKHLTDNDRLGEKYPEPRHDVDLVLGWS